ncbi:ankyrin repeat domain-containing protein [Paucibacter sp. APW11]|uniref:Ankyrin repeat domain-containing protein n=1 Tax=Roseateles aquae TaxID=3077235 RepID=A0ABU3PCA8_9BURK|nr:ankyrin repeat domain-containing protein [Paucibacter sp. APW11]MDT8999967.1 ankyrin repeat domain-containing protein [Paucibacter sp. APW11]
METRSLWRRIGVQIAALAAMLILWSCQHPPSEFWASSRVRLGLASLQGDLRTDVSTEPFTIELGNWLSDGWVLKTRMRAQAQVVNGRLEVQLRQLQIEPSGPCGDLKDSCDLEGLQLLLTRENGANFTTLAETETLPITARLREDRHWRWRDAEAPTLVMQLPESLQLRAVRLRLSLQSSGPSWVHPGDGPYLALHRALARAQGAADPCLALTDAADALRAGCDQRVMALLRAEGSALSRWWRSLRPHWEGSLDDLLLQALELQNRPLVRSLLEAGASAQAQHPDNASYTAIGVAAEANDTELLALLVRAGARPDEHRQSPAGLTFTPLTQALRHDGAEAVAWLLAHGASLELGDKQGWTTMHVAAYQSAVRSLPLLARAGGDVNERTTAYRGQTVLQTALQFADVDLIRGLLEAGASRHARDDNGKNGCDWAREFRRGAEIEQLVCGAH